MALAISMAPSALAQTATRVTSVTIAPAQLYRGQSTGATIRLDGPAPSDGLRVSVGVCNSFVYKPDPSGSIVIPAGQSAVSIPITPDPQSPGYDRGPATCVRAWTYVNNVPVTVQSNLIEVVPVATYIAFPVTQAFGGQRLSGQVRMGSIDTAGTLIGAFPAPQDIVITLGGQSSITNAPGEDVRFFSGGQVLPDRVVTIRAGTIGTAFDVQLSDVLWEQEYRVTKTGGGPYRTFQIFNLKPNYVAGVSVNPTTMRGGGTGVGTVTLYSTAGVGGAKVALRSFGAVLSMPGEVTVPEGQSSVPFPIQLGTVNASGNATLIASRAYPANWTSTRPELPTTFRVEPGQGPNLTLTELTVTPPVVVGGQTAVGRVQLSGAAPAGGINLNLYRMGGCCADMPNGLTVPAGSNSATFQIRTSPQSDTTIPEIQASLFQSAMRAPLRVIGMEVEAFQMPRSVFSGSAFQVRVRLKTPAPQTEAIRFQLSSNDPSAFRSRRPSPWDPVSRKGW